MTLTLRVVLVLVSLMTLLFVMRKVRSSKIRLEDSMAWILFSGVLFVLSVFPGIFDFLAELAGVYSTVNFVFLFFIFVLLILCFSLNMKVSQMDTKIKELTQLLAIEKFERYSNDLLKGDEGDEETGREQRLP